MSYIGNQPPDIGAYDVESFNGGGTSFTLKRAATVSSVLLFIDGVRQTPTDAYTVSGVTLTTTATTPSGTDNVTVMFMGDVVDIGAPSADTVSTAKIQDDAVTAAKLANSINTEITANTAKVTNATHTGDVTGATALTIATDAVDIAMLSATGSASVSTFLRGDNAWAAAGGNNAPYWHVYLSADQSISNVTWTKCSFNTEVLDSDSEYDNSSNYRYTIVTAGRYYVYSMMLLANDAANWDRIRSAIYKNGSAVTGVGNIPGGWYTDTASTPNQVIGWSNVCAVMDLSASDYLEVYGYVGIYGAAGCTFDAQSTFGGFKLL